MIAIVSHFNRIKGFGFAVPADERGLPDNSRPDIFIHARNITNKKYLTQGDLISYDIGDFNGRPVAINVVVLPPARPESIVQPSPSAKAVCDVR